jgi:hypothetical protein
MLGNFLRALPPHTLIEDVFAKIVVKGFKPDDKFTGNAEVQKAAAQGGKGVAVIEMLFQNRGFDVFFRADFYNVRDCALRKFAKGRGIDYLQRPAISPNVLENFSVKFGVFLRVALKIALIIAKKAAPPFAAETL